MNKHQFRDDAGFIPLFGLAIVLIIAIIAAGSIYYFSKNDKNANTNVATINVSNSNRNVNGNGNSNLNANTNANSNVNGGASENVNSIANSNVNVNSNTNSSTNSNTNTASTTVPVGTNAERYTSPSFGINFVHTKTYGGQTVKIKETTDTIYVYTADTVAEQGQYVRQFTKAATDTLTKAVQKQFLTGYATADCFVKSTTVSGLANGWEAVQISYPAGDLNADNPWANADKCPAVYTTTNGISYFVMNTAQPTKYYFFSIGQYIIPSDVATTGWEKTAQVSTVATTIPADWKTYMNTKIAYSIGLPSGWNPVSEYDGRTMPLQGNSDMSSFQEVATNSPDISLIIQACSLASPYTCAWHTLSDRKTKSGFVPTTDPALVVKGFDAGRDSNGNLNYVRENSQYFIIAYPSKISEKNIQEILGTFQFTK